MSNAQITGDQATCAPSAEIGRPSHKDVDYPAVVARLRLGEGLRAIARELGVSGAAISRGARRHGWQGGKVGRKAGAHQ